MTASRKGMVIGAIALGVVVIGLTVGYFAWFRNTSTHPSTALGGGAEGGQKGKATITASPNPAPAGTGKFGTTTITWDTGDGTVGEVYVSVNGGAEKKFAGNRVKGSQDASWIGKGEYEFRLYAGTEHKTVLASVKVTRSGS